MAGSRRVSPPPRGTAGRRWPGGNRPLPVPVFMDFVEYDQRQRVIMTFDLLEEERIFKQAGSVFGNIPVEVEAIGKFLRNHLRQGRVATLAGPG